MQSEHTYILESSQWTASGCYFDEQGQRVPVDGESICTRTKGLWTLESSMSLFTTPPTTFYNTYIIESSDHSLNYKSTNPVLGEMKGQFVFVADAILSSWISRDGKCSGVETLLKIDDSTYRNWGSIFRSGSKLSSWTVVLKKSASTKK